ncbi:MAG: putative rRNA maturation factor YbeY [Actinobacteria bacterium]|nr:putative rRNA maturation factor YbeY [Actinomycetota bacterium]
MISATLFRISIRQHPRPAPFHGGRLRVLVRRTLSSIAPASADIRILVVDDLEMKKWNSEFLGRRRTTNVISFPEEDPPGAVPGKQAHRSMLAGDILISAPTCLRQTAGWPGSPEERVLYFIIHGILHLAGYDHERGATDARRMRAAEDKLYRSVLGVNKARGK